MSAPFYPALLRGPLAHGAHALVCLPLCRRDLRLAPAHCGCGQGAGGRPAALAAGLRGELRRVRWHRPAGPLCGLQLLPSPGAECTCWAGPEGGGGGAGRRGWGGTGQGGRCRLVVRSFQPVDSFAPATQLPAPWLPTRSCTPLLAALGSSGGLPGPSTGHCLEESLENVAL